MLSMKVLIPENTLLWTTKGFCFGSDITYGTEIFIINSNNELKPHPIVADLEEPEIYLTSSLIFENQVSTILPNYKIKNLENFITIDTISEGDSFTLLDADIMAEFIKFQNEHAVQCYESSPVSIAVAQYLSFCSLSAKDGLVQFEKEDEESARAFTLQIQKDLSELGGVASRRLSLKWGKNFSQNAKYRVYYESKKFYDIRKQINFLEDKVSKIIYSNGYAVFSMFLRGLFQNLFPGHGIFSIRTEPTGDYAVLSVPWDTKIRKLLQNTLLIENNFKLSVSVNTKQRNLNELILHYVGLDVISQKILAVKHNHTKCYEIDIPMGTKMIMDNLIVKLHEITDDEKQELDDKYEDVVEINFQLIRKQITSKQTTMAVTNFITTNQIARSKNHYRIHIVGKFDQKGVVQSGSTRFGDSNKVTGILYDDTGEIRLQLWGDIAKKIKNNDILELNQAYSKNGILNNKQGGVEIIHEI